MVHHGFPRVITHKSTFEEKDRLVYKKQYGYDDQLFSLLEKQLFTKFFVKRLGLNVHKNDLLKRLFDMLHKWNSIGENVQVQEQPLILNNHYQSHEMFDFIGLKDLLLVDANIEFFQKDVMGIVVVLSTTNNMCNNKIVVFKGEKWEPIFNEILNSSYEYQHPYLRM